MPNLFNWFTGLFSGKGDDAKEQEAGQRIPTIKFDASVVTEDIERVVYEAILRRPDFSGLAPATLKAVHAAAMKGIRRGGDLGIMRVGVEEALPGFERGQIVGLIQHINRVAFVHINRKRDLELGFEEAEWRYTGGACITCNPPPDQEKEMDALHKSLDGRRFKLFDGMLVDNQHYWPGLEFGCKCYYRTILAGWND